MTNRPHCNGQICWVYTKNLQAAADFYGNSLGLECIREDDSSKIFSTGPSSFIGVCVAFADRVVEPRGGMITIVTHEVDAWYEQLLGAGVLIRKAPHRLRRFNIYTFFVEDPNGYIIEFQEFLDSNRAGVIR